MIIKPIEFTLKNGIKGIIRTPVVEDAEAMLDLMSTVISETEFLLRTPGESKYTLEYERDFLQKMNDSPTDTMLVCFIDGVAVATSSIWVKDHLKTKHRAQVGIAIRKAYWNQGIGSKLFALLTEIALENKELMQLELEFIEGNERAKALYEKFGFKVYGVRPNSIKQLDGRLLNEYLMLKDLSDLRN